VGTLVVCASQLGRLRERWLGAIKSVTPTVAIACGLGDSDSDSDSDDSDPAYIKATGCHASDSCNT
jgi:hypothetical protein